MAAVTSISVMSCMPEINYKTNWRTHRYIRASLQTCSHKQYQQAACKVWHDDSSTSEENHSQKNRPENPWCLVYTMWMWKGVCQTSRSLETRCKEYVRHLFLGQPENSAVAELVMGTGSMKFNNIYRMAKVEWCVDCLVKEVIVIHLCPMNFNKYGSIMLSRTRQILLQQVWNTSSDNWDQTLQYFTRFPWLRTVITINIPTTRTAYTV